MDNFFIDPKLLYYEEKLGNITIRPHPNGIPYIICNYTPQCEYNRAWNEINSQCRGLILHEDTYELVSRPFKKFFNYGQVKLEDIPGPEDIVNITEKLDGSLGIHYSFLNKNYIATRGSFDSEQAKVATDILNKKYKHIKFNKNYTYLFEIIYPENRIVVNYGDLTDLVLIAVIDNITGKDILPINNFGFPVRPEILVKPIVDLLAEDLPNKEGYVILFKNGVRLKIKFDTYVKIHKFKYQLTKKAIIEELRDYGNLNKILDGIPDEFHDTLKEYEQDAIKSYCKLLDYVNDSYSKLQLLNIKSRKDLAQEILTNYPTISSFLFAKIDGKFTDYSIWERVLKDDKQ